MVSARLQVDEVGPKGVFEESVSKMMASEPGMTRDVAEMLVAAKTMSADGTVDLRAKKLNRALRAMDHIQKTVADLLETTCDDFTDLYPIWRMYILCKDPEQRERLFCDYQVLLDSFINGQAALIEDLGYLVALEKVLLPSNVYADPYGRIKPSSDITEVLDNF